MYLDDQRNRIELGQRVGSPGGEGTTYAIVGQPDLVAKIYHSKPDRAKCGKLASQAAASLMGIRAVAAWPQSLIHDRAGVVGFVMPRVLGKSIHLLYRPDDRSQHFPGVSWQGLIDVARNVAAAFHSLHRHGVIMGDVNESNILVDPKTGGVKFIDCDSFQFTTSDGTVHPCPVFTAGWTPPELLESPSQINHRHSQHDLFGLAVLVFHLLFMGRHPFAGVPPEHLLENPPSLEDLIKRGTFPYSPARRGGFKPPPNFLSLTILPDSIAQLFEQAFASRSRPSADEWFRGLANIELGRCRWGHVYFRKLAECPWCAIWNQGGGNFFVAVSVDGGTDTLVLEIDRLLLQVKGVSFPGSTLPIALLANRQIVPFTVPDLAKLSYPAPPPLPFPKLRRKRIGFWLGALMAIAGLVEIFAEPWGRVFWVVLVVAGCRLVARGTANPAYNAEVRRRKQAPDLIKEDIQLLVHAMQQLASNSIQAFAAERDAACQRVIRNYTRQLDILRSQREEVLKGLAALRDKAKGIPRLKEMWKRKIAETSQLESYLRGIGIPYDSIPYMSRERREILVAHGIYSAWDLKTTGGIPNMGIVSTELRHWLMRIEAGFRFNPQAPLSSAANQDVQRHARDGEGKILNEFQNLRSKWARCRKLADPAQFAADAEAMVAKELLMLDTAYQMAKRQFISKLDKLDAKIRDYGQAVADAETCPRAVGKWE